MSSTTRRGGKRIDENFELPADTLAVDVAVDATGRVLIADNGPRQQVLFFSKKDGRYEESGSLGERGGIFSGVAGRPGPRRFNGLTGVGVDARGNVYVSTNGIGPRYEPIGAGLGATLESYASDGKQNWLVQDCFSSMARGSIRRVRTAFIPAISASNSTSRNPRGRTGNMSDSCPTDSSIPTIRSFTPTSIRACRLPAS